MGKAKAALAFSVDNFAARKCVPVCLIFEIFLVDALAGAGDVLVDEGNTGSG